MIEEQKGATEAENLLEDLGFNALPISPKDVVTAIDFDDFTVVIEEQYFDSDGILGKAVGNDKGALIYINANISDPGRLRFTAAHEIGHVSMHIIPQLKMSFECGSKELSNPFNDPIERQANGFASGLLMPKTLIRKHCDCEINWRNIQFISELCGASLEATYRRFSFLEKAPNAMVIHHNGKFSRFVASKNFEFYIDQTPLSSHQKTLMTDVKKEPYPHDFDTVDASDWINPQSKGITLESIYTSTILLNEGFTYTILTYDDDCIAEEEDEYY
ncbi:ImmA/IrrE family metallo-endopeptidase [Marinimicrobium sp. ABcell2]|uniref:ImmA/IrrE family metallo-endopeptidase n=1 Tax=Marinimicrobium sp. ABcell2 TaxID=3069751 RepID=UPI0027B30115|nr:ImmA/IrrE family metallo-endopeptidase [Marinimicrobium sp. ABcell2]MDQ2077110.1 ImmA/IrrE family metallo-endopeptidase [Marinimicrobium sp. ABcell2]